jgi:hypothetical protein
MHGMSRRHFERGYPAQLWCERNLVHRLNSLWMVDPRSPPTMTTVLRSRRPLCHRRTPASCYRMHIPRSVRSMYSVTVRRSARRQLPCATVRPQVRRRGTAASRVMLTDELCRRQNATCFRHLLQVTCPRFMVTCVCVCPRVLSRSVFVVATHGPPEFYVRSVSDLVNSKGAVKCSEQYWWVVTDYGSIMCGNTAVGNAKIT